MTSTIKKLQVPDLVPPAGLAALPVSEFNSEPAHVIVTAEEIVDKLDKADIPSPAVHAVAAAPRGAWPTSCHPLYPLGGGELRRLRNRRLRHQRENPRRSKTS